MEVGDQQGNLGILFCHQCSKCTRTNFYQEPLAVSVVGKDAGNAASNYLVSMADSSENRYDSRVINALRHGAVLSTRVIHVHCSACVPCELPCSNCCMPPQFAQSGALHQPVQSLHADANNSALQLASSPLLVGTSCQ